MITLASHKTFQKTVTESKATAALFIFSEDRQMSDYLSATEAVGDENCFFRAVRMHNTQPGRNRGKPLPSNHGVMEIIKFFSIHAGTEVVVCDLRGKGLALSAAVIGLYLHHGAARKAVEQVLYQFNKPVPNGYVLRLADAILGSPLATAADSLGSSKYISFSPKAYRAENEPRTETMSVWAAVNQGIIESDRELLDGHRSLAEKLNKETSAKEVEDDEPLSED